MTTTLRDRALAVYDLRIAARDATERRRVAKLKQETIDSGVALLHQRFEILSTADSWTFTGLSRSGNGSEIATAQTVFDRFRFTCHKPFGAWAYLIVEYRCERCSEYVSLGSIGTIDELGMRLRTLNGVSHPHPIVGDPS